MVSDSVTAPDMQHPGAGLDRAYAILQGVCAERSISERAIRSHRRTKGLIDARRWFCQLCEGE